ncbi:MAG: hypothetical protein KAT43_05155 [Nanoarchaeota archaeon]|nr:hypothetical protein [Nanoarchaeota archaeon]
MKKLDYRYFGLLLFVTSLIFLIFSESSITGAAVGGPGIYGVNSIIGFILLLVSVIIFVANSDQNPDLERRLAEIEDVKIRRELLSDMLRAKKLAKDGYDVNGLWNPKLSEEENKRVFFEKFYDDICEEITDGYKKHLEAKLKKRLTSEEFESYIDPEEFRQFRGEALSKIVEWNEKILSGEFVPLFIIDSKEKVRDFSETCSRVVIYGPKHLKGRSKNYYNKKAKKKGEVISAHEIVNPEAINEPKKLAKVPHIHWELEYILRNDYKV